MTHTTGKFFVHGDTAYLIVVDVRNAGRHSDGGVLSNSKFGQALENGLLALPGPSPLPGTTEPLPFVIVGDEVFPLRTHMLRPYPGKNLPGMLMFVWFLPFCVYNS